jgi:ABC-2 type transport system ATP-binding protein
VADPVAPAADPAAGLPAITVERLTKRYGERTVIDGVSMEVRAGEILALLGPNGAGKTTTVEIIEGYRRADAGAVRVLGGDPWRAGRAHRARVGLMLQSGGFDMRARPAETLREFAAYHADALDPEGLIDDLGLREVAATPYRRLSGGERQRLALAVALVGRPEVLILDEPTAGMDPVVRASVRDRVARARADGVAILMTSHELAEVERLADRIVVLVSGRMVASGTPAELAAGLRPRLRFGLDRPLDATELEGLGRALDAVVVGSEDTASYEAAAAPTPAMLTGLATWAERNGRLMTWSRTVGGSLEDAYLDLVAATPDSEDRT